MQLVKYLFRVSIYVLFIFNTQLTYSGTCTGSSNCTACKTCNYCAHCNEGGGSCGVCGGGYDTHYGYSATSPEKSSGNIFWGIVKWILIIGGIIVVLSFLRK
jgi:hypothetical protein